MQWPDALIPYVTCTDLAMVFIPFELRWYFSQRLFVLKMNRSFDGEALRRRRRRRCCCCCLYVIDTDLSTKNKKVLPVLMKYIAVYTCGEVTFLTSVLDKIGWLA